MEKTKFGKYIMKPAKTKKLNGKLSATTPVELKGLKDWGGIQHRMKWSFIHQPVLMEEPLHSHDFDEFLCFLGRDLNNTADFGAEVEIALGSEGEKHTITAPGIICIPKGLIHGPLNFKSVKKPILFSHIYLAPEYTKKAISKIVRS